ncbi:hypothetical protein TSUD_325230 [Trifolium subterraneum]|uniref:Replication factor A C-terminal domain-containing protein n=1 Tax=Trifolium subterraneum TaxID=3900 RepID=A0A2Z6LLT8_TRISU|nr:hypothetical protein TSUD_325230 [Trifolium subterraneum]
MTYSQQHAGPKKICAAFTVVDSSGVELSCTLWGHFATTLFNYLNGRTKIGPIVIIMKHGKIKDASVYLRILLALESVGSTQGSTSSQFSGGDRFLIGAPIIQFSELMNLPENTICITMATTRKILTSKHGWYYKQCDHCPKKTDGHAPPYKCLLDHPSPKPVINLPPDFACAAPLSLESVSSTQGSTSSQFSGGDRFLIGAPIIQFSKLKNLPENTICITMATTRKILTSKHGWYYKQCDH